jgi:hypothetical protein
VSVLKRLKAKTGGSKRFSHTGWSGGSGWIPKEVDEEKRREVWIPKERDEEKRREV